VQNDNARTRARIMPPKGGTRQLRETVETRTWQRKRAEQL
jgi:hypothetical protein